ncbi:uncharacterized protein LOC131225733 isoform X3 [Magnolia sinica]|uniref:uncharacterized protein LOC131225733 isoform X3 n=1 Tax=Magnolia sinica TaxID=86752 RepID=UPI00265ADC0C|nr:uncharacterized protein LOC131225733 isoform X3 [Magnolia sinica]
MALVIYGYDFICFALVAGAIFGSLWVIRRTEGDQICDDATRYESLLFDRSDRDGFVGQMRNGHVGSTQLWMSCWREVHPGWLLATRAVSAFVLAGFLAWDIRCYDSTIFVYYTEWTVALVIIYFALGTVISAHGCWMYSKHRLENEERGGRSRKADLEESKSTVTTYKTAKISGAIEGEGHHEQEIIKQRAGFWGYLMQTVYQACAGAVMLTDIVFWCLIVPFLSIQHFSLNMVSLLGSHSYPLLRLIRAYRRSEKFNFPEIVPTSICKALLASPISFLLLKIGGMVWLSQFNVSLVV